MRTLDCLGQVSEPNGEVTIILDSGTANERTETVPTDDQGNWEYTPNLSDGLHTVQIAVTDEAGNGPSAPSDPLSFTVDTAPLNLSIDKAVDDVPNSDQSQGSTEDISDGGLTNDNMPLIVGSAKEGAQVTLLVNGSTYGPVIADSNGQWQIQVTDALPDGTRTFTATARDAAGNESVDEFTLEIDTSVPDAPLTLQGFDDAGVVTGFIAQGSTIDDAAPVFSGTAEPGATVHIYNTEPNGDRIRIGTTVADDSGNWSLEIPLDFEANVEIPYSITATQVDPAGNGGERTEPRA